MSEELISRKTRIEFREFLVGWTLREIADEFDAAGIACDHQFEPNISGARRSVVEQHYHSLGFSKPADVRRLIALFEGILMRGEQKLSSAADAQAAENALINLAANLKRDGFLVQDGRVVPTSPRARRGLNPESGHVRLSEADQSLEVLSDAYVRELASKCDARLSTGDFDGAITTGRTVLEAILGELESRLAGARGDYKGDLPKQFKQVSKLLRMDDQRPELDDRFKDVIRGLVMVANGLAPLRNSMSDGHARVRKPAPHHARVVVNAAKTISTFLIESYDYQRKKGLLAVPKSMVGSGG